MKKKVGEIARQGIKVGEVLSSKGDKTYDIYKVGDKYTCNCMGYAVRRKCRHTDCLPVRALELGNNGEAVKEYNEDGGQDR